MVAVDTNVLLYAHRAEAPLHKKALARLVKLASGNEPWSIPTVCLAEFARVITHPRVYRPPFSAEEVREALARLLGSPSLRLIGPGPRFGGLFVEALSEGKTTGNLVFDAQIVAICREAGGVTLLTEDRDFARFGSFPVERL